MLHDEEDAEWIAKYRREHNCSLREAKEVYVYTSILRQIDNLEHESDGLKDLLKGLTCYIHDRRMEKCNSEQA